MKSVLKLSARFALASAAAAAMMVSTANAEETVNVYNWVDYIGENTLEDFKKATGITVVYDTYDSAETEQAKLLAGNTGYDVVMHSGAQLPRFIQAGAFAKLDKSKLPNEKNLDPDIMKVLETWDPGNAYAVPYMWGTTGLAFNMDMVNARMPNAPVTSMRMIMDPQIAAKMADCGISILESPTDVIPMVLSYLGKDPNSEDPKDFDAVVEAFKPVRQYIKTFDASNYLNAIPNKELCVINSWSGDYAVAAGRAAEAGVKLNLEYHVPETGSPAWFDAWIMPADAPNKENGLKFLNFLMEPEVIAACTNFTYYANANLAANKFVLEEILDDPAVYTPDSVKKRLWTSITYSPKGTRAMNRAWAKIKGGS